MLQLGLSFYQKLQYGHIQTIYVDRQLPMQIYIILVSVKFLD